MMINLRDEVLTLGACEDCRAGLGVPVQLYEYVCPCGCSTMVCSGCLERRRS